MHKRYAKLPFIVAVLLALPRVGTAADFYTVQLHASKMALLADGKSSTTIIAEVRDSSGNAVRGPVAAEFQTTLGTLSAAEVNVYGGQAMVRLTSATVEGTASVTAFVPGGASVSIDVLFTNDPEATYQGNQYVQILGSSYLAYSAIDRVIEADGSGAGARLTYRNITITADSMQLACKTNTVQAHGHVVLKRGKTRLDVTRLYYPLISGRGIGMMKDNDGRLRTVEISGENLHTQNSPTAMPRAYYEYPRLKVKLIIVARNITYFPNDRLQFRRPRFFQDQTQILSLPYYEMPINTLELFSDQFISVGTQGVGLQLPIYYTLSPRSTGIFYIRHMEQMGASSFATEPGWSFDIAQGYSSPGASSYEGAAAFTGLTRSDWGFRWSHNQQFGPSTQTSFYLDFPQHDGVVSSVSLNQQSKLFRWGADLSAGKTWDGAITSNLGGDTFIETQPHNLALPKGLLYTVGANMTTAVTRGSTTAITNTDETDEGLTLRVFTHPVNLDKQTRLTDSLSVGNVWSSLPGKSGFSSLASLAVERTYKSGADLSLNYDFVLNPAGLDSGSGRHRLSALYKLAAKDRLQVSFTGSTYLDADDSSLISDMSYRLNRDWRLLSDVTLERFDATSFDDLEFTMGRRWAAREFQLTYSTYYHRVMFQLTATSL